LHAGPRSGQGSGSGRVSGRASRPRRLKTLHLYLLRQVAATLVVTVGVFAFVLLLGNVLKDVLDLLASPKVSPGLLLKALGLLVPFVLSFALPIGMLTASLLTFGRLSADQELTAIRAGGISLASAIVPVIALSVVLCGVCFWFVGDVGPRSRVAFKGLRDSVLRSQATLALGEGRYLELGSVTLYARKVDGDLLKDVRIFAFTNGACYLDLFAPEAELRRDSNRFPAALSLRNFQGLVQMAGGWQGISAEERIEPIANFRPARSDSPKLSEMSMGQLLQERSKRRTEGIDVTPVEVQIHRQASFSFACLGFTLVGIPLGIRAHRRETNIGVAMALVLLLLYYSFIIVAQSLDTKPHLYPQYLLWIPNLLFQAVGVALIRRADGRA